jgi:hypothetical protein
MAHFSSRKVDRRVSVAPMMDWIDEANPTNKIINLGAAKWLVAYMSPRESVCRSCELAPDDVTRYAVTRYIGEFYGVACRTNEGHA